MTFIQELWLMLASTWIALELIIIYKTRVSGDGTGQPGYRSEKLIWWVVVFSISVAFGFKQLHLVQIPINYDSRQIMSFGLMSIGLLVRFSAVKSLGRFFSTTAVIQTEHLLIDHGLYHYIRHPASTQIFLTTCLLKRERINLRLITKGLIKLSL